MNWQEKIKTEDLRIRHLRCDGRLQATIIHRRGETLDELVPYGMSVVSKRDQPIIERGRAIAYARYLKACNNPFDQPKYKRDNPLNKFLKMDTPLSGHVSPAEIKFLIEKFNVKTRHPKNFKINSDNNCCGERHHSSNLLI